MRPYFLFIYLFFLFNIIQHNITINLTITGRKKRRRNSKKKKQQKDKKAKYESSTDKQQLEEQIEK